MDLTVEILKDIRTAVQETNHRIDTLGETLGARIETLGARIESLDDRIDATSESLGARIDRLAANQVRMFTEIAELHGTVRDIRDAAVENRGMRNDLADHERRIAALEEGGG